MDRRPWPKPVRLKRPYAGSSSPRADVPLQLLHEIDFGVGVAIDDRNLRRRSGPRED